jgi:hypothetical protein
MLLHRFVPQLLGNPYARGPLLPPLSAPPRAG